MARPKVSPAEKRSVRFSFRLTEQEFQKLIELAQTCACTPGMLIRNSVFKGRPPALKSARLDVATYLELKKIGVNVNQLARHVNSTKVLSGTPVLLEELLAQQDKIIKILISDSGTENR